ncbi:hypothetical protein C8F01DRAFT_777653 [Mycena amicta]|nr:hypothetical protein C8F01DRAFT_777653 [Mycena amicta]
MQLSIRLLMSSRASYLYEPLGGQHPKRTWRDVLCSPTRWTAILLIVALSFTSIVFLTVQGEWPWRSSSVVPKIFPPASEEATAPISSGPVPYPPAPPDAAHVGSATYHPFVAPSAAQAIADAQIRPVRAHTVLSDACLDRWVSSGQWAELCTRGMVNESKIDLVYVWVNGSDVLHQQARKALLDETKFRTKDARFREHNELMFSLRSAREATRTWSNSTWHVITADVRDPEPLRGTSQSEATTVVVELATALARARGAVDAAGGWKEGEEGIKAEAEKQDRGYGQRRLGLVPQWLDIECSYHAEDGPEGQPPIRLQHDTQLFRLTSAPGVQPEVEDAASWLQKILPSFNSHAIESQLPQLDPKLVSDNIVALNDDQFFLLPMPPSAFHTSLYGPVFRVDPNLLVGGDASGSADGGGEWRSLGWSAYLLNQRFGSRKRPYVQHNARAMSLPLMHEAALVFGDYFAHTPLSQFRGSHKVSGEFEVNTIFLTTHFVVERHREALLYSWVVLKWGGESGVLDAEAKNGMWKDLGGEEEADVVQYDQRADRTTSEDVELNLLMAGIAPPKALDDHVQGDTTYTWTSLDGYSSVYNHLLVKTRVPRSCLDTKTDSDSAWDLFRQLLTEDPPCGDQIISALIHTHKSGLGAFLPAALAHPPSLANDPLTLPLVLPLTAPPLPINPRAFAVRLLQRYAHVLGDSPTLFVGMRSAAGAERLLKGADGTPETALLCINDDLGNSETTLKSADAVLARWFKKRWPEKLRCEV